jgi:hypothetical protein
MDEDPITIFSKLSASYPKKTGGEKARDVVIDTLRAVPGLALLGDKDTIPIPPELLRS